MRHFQARSILLAVVLTIGLATEAKSEGEGNLKLYSYGGMLWKSTDKEFNLDAVRLGMVQILQSPANTFLMGGWQPKVSGFGETDVYQKTVKKAGLKFEWGQSLQIVFGKHITAFGWQTPSPLEEGVITGSPIYELLTIYATGLHLNVNNPHSELHLGYYGQNNQNNLWQISYKKEWGWLSAGAGVGSLPDRQLFGKLAANAKKFKSDVTLISTNNTWQHYHADDLATHWRTTALFLFPLELYWQWEWKHAFTGIGAGGNLVFAENTRLMLAYTTSGQDRWLMRATWYIKRTL